MSVCSCNGKTGNKNKSASGSAFTVARDVYSSNSKKSTSSLSGILISKINQVLQAVFGEGLNEAAKHKKLNNPVVLTGYIVLNEESEGFN